MQDCETWASRIGKFVNVASHVRINATNHPTWRATLHHFTYRANDYWPDAEREESFFDWRRENTVPIGHDVWIGHGVDDHAGRDGRQRRGDRRRRGGDPRRRALYDRRRRAGAADQAPLREGIGARMDALAWWDWPHATLRAALDDFRRALGRGVP